MTDLDPLVWILVIMLWNMLKLKRFKVIENLPFEDNSFDLVLCCEVLEHLPDDIYQDALKEIQRVSNEYIFNYSS